MSRSARRGKIEILRDILEACMIPRKKTHIIYACNLNFTIVKKYLQHCFLKGYLTQRGNEYLTTERGKEYNKLLYQITF